MVEPETVAHETIYRAIYILPRGELRKQLIGLLRQGHKLRRPVLKARTGAEACLAWCRCMSARRPC